MSLATSHPDRRTFLKDGPLAVAGLSLIPEAVAAKPA